MAKRDVELVLRARDQASALLEKVTKALEKFEAAEKDAGAASGEFSRRLDSLKARLKEFSTASGGIDAFKKLASELDKSKRAMAGMQAEADRLSTRVEKLSRAALEAAQHENRMAVEYEKATQAVKKQKEALASAEAEMKSLAKAIAEEEKALKKASKAAETRNRQLKKADAELKKAKARWKELAKEISLSGTATKKTLDAYAAAERRVKRKSDALKALAADYRKANEETRRAKAAIAELDTEYARAKTAVKDYSANLAEAKDRQRLFADASRDAATAYARLEQELNKTRSAYAAQKAEIESARAAISRLSADLNRAGDAYRTVAAKADAAMAQMLESQKRAAQAAFTDWARAEQAVAKYQQQLGKSDLAKVFLGGQAAINDKLKEAEIRAKEAEARYKTLSGTVDKLGNVMKMSATDIGSTQVKLEAFDKAMKSVYADTKKVEESQRRATKEIEKLGLATKRASTFTERFRANMRALGADTRKSLSYTQRLRGEVLALIKAYGGIYAVVRGVQGVTEAYRQWAAAQRSVAVAMDTLNPGVIAREMEYIRDTANRLGVDLQVTAREYSRLAVATRGTNITMDETRKIFESVSGAARVMGLDTEQTKRVFTALVQIASKGKIQMEELRQQLGDNLPGAIKLMAEAAGYGKESMDEFYKAIQAGEIDAKYLVNFAEKLNQYFGPQLAKAMKDNTAELARLKNAFFELYLFIGEQGLLDALSKLYRTLTEIAQSEDFRAFLSYLTKGAAALIEVLAEAVKWWKLFAAAVGYVIAKRFYMWAIAAAGAIGNLSKVTKGAAAATTLLAAAQARLNAVQAAGMAIGGRLKGLAVGFLGTISRLHPVLLAVAAAAGLVYLAWKKFGPAAEEAKKGTDDLSVSAEKAGQSLGKAAEKSKELVKGISESDVKGATEQLKQYGASAEYVRRMAGEIKFRLYVEETGSTTLTAAADAIDQMAAALDRIANVGGKGLKAVYDGAKKLSDKFVELTQRLQEFFATLRYEIARTPTGILSDTAQAMDGVADSAERAGKSSKKFAEGLSGDELQKAKEELARVRGEADGVHRVLDVPAKLDVEVNPVAVDNLKAVSEAAGALRKEFADIALEADKAFGIIAKLPQEVAASTASAGTSLDQFTSKISGFQFDGKFAEMLTSLASQLSVISEKSGQAAVNIENFLVSLGTLPNDLSQTTAVLAESADAFRKVASAIREMRVELEAIKQYSNLTIEVVAKVEGLEDVRGLRDAVEDLKDSLEGLDVLAQEAFSALTDAVEPVADALEDVEKAAKGVDKALGEVEKASKALRKEFDRLEAPEEALDETQAKTEDLTDVINVAREAVEEYIGSMDRLARSTRDIVQAAADAETAIRNYVQALGDVAGDVKAVTDSFGKLTDVIRDHARYFDQLVRSLSAVEKAYQDAADAANAYYVAARQKVQTLPGSNPSSAYSVPAFHRGGVVGKQGQAVNGNHTLSVPLSVFRNAPHYATGGLAGFKPDEVPAVLHRGEEVLTVDDPRHRRNLRDGLVQQTSEVTFDASGLESAGAAFAASALLGSQAVQLSMSQAADYLYQQVVLATNWFVEKIDGLRKQLEESFNSMISAVERALSSANRTSSSSSGGSDNSWDAFWEDQKKAFRRIYGNPASFMPAHAGGIVGSSGRISSPSPYAPRVVNPAVFAGAKRYHSGGLPGLKSDEVPAILQKGEEVLARNDPRNVLNGGKAAAGQAARSPVNLKIINTIDPGDVVSEGLATPEGEQAILNFIGENRNAIRERIG